MSEGKTQMNWVQLTNATTVDGNYVGWGIVLFRIEEIVSLKQEIDRRRGNTTWVLLRNACEYQVMESPETILSYLGPVNRVKHGQ